MFGKDKKNLSPPLDTPPESNIVVESPEIHVMPEKFLSEKVAKRKGARSLKKNLILGLIIVVVMGGLMATAAYLFTKSFKKTPVNQNVSLPSPTNQNENLNLNLDKNLNINQNINLNQNINAEPPISTADWLIYTNEEYGYEVKYPTDWSYRERTDDKAVGFDKKDEIYKLDPDVTTYIVSIFVVNNEKGINIHQWLEYYYQGMSFSDKKVIQVAGYNAIQTEMAPTMVSDIIETHIQKDDQVFIIRLSGKPNFSDMDKSYYNQILATFRFIPVTKPPVNTNINTNINTGLPLPSSPDSDNDGLTDLEEALYGTNLNAPDTDQDGYLDGDEVLNLYDPTQRAGIKLEESNLVNSYLNSKYNYTILYPTSWQISSLDNEGEVMFTSVTKEFVEVIVLENLTGLKEAREWYLNQFPTISPSQISDILTGDLKGIRSPDGFTIYFLEGNFIYTLTYNVGLKESINFKTTFEMMVRSFKLFANPLE